MLKWVWSLYSQGKTIEAADDGSGAVLRAPHDPAQRGHPSSTVCTSDDAKLPVVLPESYVQHGAMAALPSYKGSISLANVVLQVLAYEEKERERV